LIRRIESLLAGASAISLLSAASIALADAAPAPASGAQSTTTVEEIVVTAQKRAQSLQRVPMAVTAITSTTLTQAGVVDMQGVSTLVPALSTEETNGSGNQAYRIRGIGSDPNTPTFEPDVALFIDGVYLPRSGMSVDDLVDLSRVEVLEGPQSTLYGKNATGGVINIVTKGPSRTFGGSLEGSYSELDSSLKAPVYRIAGSITGPITDHVRGDFSLVTYNQGDSYKNLYPGAANANNLNRYALRGELEADLWQDATLRLSAMRSEVYNTRSNDPDVMYYAAPGQAGGPNTAYKLDYGPLGGKLGISPRPDNNPNDRVICTAQPMQTSTYSNVLSATLNSKVGRNNFTAITAVSDYANHVQWPDVVQVVMPVVNYNDVQKGGTFSEELRLTSPTGDKLEWLTGLYFQHVGFARGNEGNSPTFTLDPAAGFIPLPAAAPLPAAFVLGKSGDEGFLNSKSRSSYEAVFGQATYHINEQFALTAGLRAQTEEKHASVDNSYQVSAANPTPATLAMALGAPPATPTPISGCGQSFPVNLITMNLTPTSIPTGKTTCQAINSAFDHRTSSVTWNTTGEYHPTRDTMLYLTVARGGKSFGYNIGFGNSTPAQREFKDEYVTNYELGAKTKLLDGRAQLSADVFRADYHNFQNAGLIGGQFLVNNAQRVSVTGFEGNGVFVFGYGFSGNAGVTYADAKYDKYTGGSPYFGNLRTDMSGQNLPLAPNWRTSMGVQYKHSLLELGNLYSRVDWSWQSSEITNTNLDPRSLQPAYSLFNARLGVKTRDGLDLSVWGNNLFNTTYIMQDAVSPLFGYKDPEFQRYLGRPREIGVTLRASF
jgi:outer membrane receptor protein involved in Fe transport